MQLQVGCPKNSLFNVGDKPYKEISSIWFQHNTRIIKDGILLIKLSNKRSIYEEYGMEINPTDLRQMESEACR